MQRYERKLNQIEVFYAEYNSLVGMNCDIGLKLNMLLKSAGKPLAISLVDGLCKRIKKDIRILNKYASKYCPSKPEPDELPDDSEPAAAPPMAGATVSISAPAAVPGLSSASTSPAAPAVVAAITVSDQSEPEKDNNENKDKQ